MYTYTSRQTDKQEHVSHYEYVQGDMMKLDACTYKFKSTTSLTITSRSVNNWHI